MAKVTSKYQVTLPKTIANEYNIRPGDDIGWVATGEVIRVIPPGRRVVVEDRDLKLRLFDQATERLRRSPESRNKRSRDGEWGREDFTKRGRSR
jgi:AbrB family looped-hinge helix DNA binding protein